MPQEYRNINISEEQAHEYYSLLMQSDPYPGNKDSNDIAVSMADSIALAFGFNNWVEHYHHFSSGNQAQLPLEENNGI